MLQNLILQFGKQLDEKAQRDFFDKLISHREIFMEPAENCAV